MRKRLIVGGGVLVALALSFTLSFFALSPHDAFAATVRHVKVNCGGQLPPVCYTTVHDAVNAAAPGDTVLVDPGTFTETSTLNITVPLRLQGAGPGVTTLRGSLPVAIAITLATPGALTIGGFTLEGNGLPYTGSSDLIHIMDAKAGNAIRIANNTFVSNAATDPNHETEFTEALSNFNSTAARLEVTHNTFTGFAQVAEFFDYAGPLTVADNTVSDLDGHSVAGHIGFEEFACCGPTQVVSNRHLFQNNTFTHYRGVGINETINYWHYSDVRVQGNTFTLSDPPGAAALEVGGFETGGFVHLEARANTFQITGGMNGINIEQAVSGLLGHNALMSTVAPGSDGIAVSIGSAVPSTLAIESNTVKAFDTGVSVANDAFPGGSATQAVAGHNNCIAGNATFGANNTSALTVDAVNNWWGAASGPFNPISNPGGTGNPVSNGITFIPFLAAASPSCL
jgi:hypothetical protein